MLLECIGTLVKFPARKNVIDVSSKSRSEWKTYMHLGWGHLNVFVTELKQLYGFQTIVLMRPYSVPVWGRYTRGASIGAFQLSAGVFGALGKRVDDDNFAEAQALGGVLMLIVSKPSMTWSFPSVSSNWSCVSVASESLLSFTDSAIATFVFSPPTSLLAVRVGKTEA